MHAARRQLCQVFKEQTPEPQRSRIFERTHAVYAVGIEMSSHIFPEVSAHLLAATPTCHWLEYIDWAAPILAEPLTIVDGMAQVPERPGTGVSWDEDAVKRYSIA